MSPRPALSILGATALSWPLLALAVVPGASAIERAATDSIAASDAGSREAHSRGSDPCGSDPCGSDPCGSDAPDGCTAQEAADDPRAADRKRVLQLADGRIVRDRTRFEAGAWQQRIGRDWVPIDGEVVCHVLESDLLSRARAMAAEVAKDDHSARAVLADWMARKGLAKEALGELDTILAASPDHAGALGVLRDREFPMELLAPGAEEDGKLHWSRIAIAGAQGSPAVREALVWRLARLREHVDLEGLIRAELVAPQFRRRTFAAHCARRLARAPMAKALVDRAVLDSMGEVRTEAALGLRDLGEATAVAPLIDALSSRFSAVRRNASESLGVAGYAAAVAPLMAHLSFLKAGGSGSSGVRANLFVGFQTAYVGDYDVEIAQASSIADPIVNVQSSGVVFDVRAQAQISRSVTLVSELRAVTSSLTRLTGNDEIGDDPGRWLEWWEANRDAWNERVAASLAPPGPGD